MTVVLLKIEMFSILGRFHQHSPAFAAILRGHSHVEPDPILVKYVCLIFNGFPFLSAQIVVYMDLSETWVL